MVATWNVKARRWLDGRRGLMDKVRTALEGEKAPIIWMHCSSLGEFEQGRPVLEKLREKYASHKFVLTFFSPSGYEVRKDYKGADYIFYLPMDGPVRSNDFVETVNPRLVLWIKYDYWYYYLNALRKRDVPLILVSGIFRKDHVFFRWYGGLQRKMLQAFTHFFVQTEGSFDRLQKLGIISNVSVSGDTRFDRVIEIVEQFEGIPLVEKFCGQQPVIVAGSTWLEDEEEIDHFARHRDRMARARLARGRPALEHEIDRALEMREPLPQRARPLGDIGERARACRHRHLHVRAADIPAEDRRFGGSGGRRGGGLRGGRFAPRLHDAPPHAQ